jgi:glycosyltransferase involved in cell wall biosynthesis
MNVLFIWDGEYPWDIRVEKVCDALLEAGHEVHLVCRNEFRKPRFERYRGLNIHRIAALPKFMGRLNSLFTFPAFFSPVWLATLVRVARNHRCSLIVARDLPMAPAALLVRKLTKASVILDMAECYPEMLRCAWQFEKFRPANLVARNPKVADWIERFVLKRVQHTFVMIEESKDRLLAKHVPPENVSIVSNTPDLSRFTNEPAASKEADCFELVYVGLLNPSRGVDTVLRAVAQLPASLDRFRLRVIGSGKHASSLRRLAAELQLGERVIFDGWVENTRVPGLIAQGSAGIVPHYACSHWNTTIPNKLFDYMAAGKPVIVSDAVPTARIVREVGCGLVYESHDPAQLARAIVTLADAETRTRLGAAGRAAVEEKFNWSRDRAVLNAAVAKYSFAVSK